MRRTGLSTRRRRRKRGPAPKLTAIQRKFIRDCIAEDRRQRPNAKLARRGLIKRLAETFNVHRETVMHVVHPRRQKTMKGKLMMAERTHCPAGHEYTPENTKILIRGTKRDGTPMRHRQCRQCKKDWAKLDREKKEKRARAAAAPAPSCDAVN